jgi:hypothetical protein
MKYETMLPGNVKRNVTEEKEITQYGEKGITEDNSEQGED